MAYEIPDLVVSFKAGGDLSSKQYYFVKMNADNEVVVCSGATDIPVGVVQNDPTSGQEAEVMVQGVSKVSSDAALTAGTLIGTSGDGQADAKTAGSDGTEYIAGQVIEGSSGADVLATAIIDCAAPARAQ